MFDTGMPILYKGYMWKEFNKDVSTLMNCADLTDNNRKAFGTNYQIEFYRDKQFTPTEEKAFVEKMTKNNDVEYIVLNGKILYDRQKYEILSDGNNAYLKKEVIKLLK